MRWDKLLIALYRIEIRNMVVIISKSEELLIALYRIEIIETRALCHGTTDF